VFWSDCYAYLIVLIYRHQPHKNEHKDIITRKYNMSEQLYYTYSTIGSGSTTDERIYAQSPGIGSVTSEPVRALMKYLSYKLPIGADLRISIEDAPISLVLAKTDYNRILCHRKYAGKDGVGRLGNLFTHAIVNPEVVISTRGETGPISAHDAISLWRSPLWKTTEEQAPPKSTTIESLEPQELQQQYMNMRWPGKLSIDTLWLQYPHCPTQLQTAADWLPQVFSAFLMLKRLKKTQLYIAAPSEMVATFIWCITRLLPRTLDIMQELTFSTYEREVGKIPVTITGTCWLPPVNHNGPFIPQSDLPIASYQPLPTNSVLAINCYTQKQTSFEIDEQVGKFVQFATQSLLQKDMAELSQLIRQAERKRYRDLGQLFEIFHIQQEEATKEKVDYILHNPSLWLCLDYANIQNKLIELMYNTKDTWWRTSSEQQIQKIYQWTLRQPESEEAVALRAFVDRVMSELSNELASNQQESNERAKYWDHLLNIMSDSLEGTLYSMLTSKQGMQAVPPLLLENYLTHFSVRAINPDNKQITEEKRGRIHNILDLLIQHSELLSEPLRPYILCWYTISNFFSQPVFNRDKLRVLHKHIDTVVLSEETRQELNQEMIAFLSKNVEAEADVVRVIDNLDNVLIRNQKDALPANVLLLKEMVRIFGKRPDRNNQPKTIMYIKVVLTETINLRKLNVEDVERTRFVDECLNSLFVSVDSSEFIQTSDWPSSFTDLWNAYQARRMEAKFAEMTQPTQQLPALSRNAVQHPSRSYPADNQQQAKSPDPSQGHRQPLQTTPYAVPMDNTSQPSTRHNSKADVVKDAYGKSPYVEDAIKAFRKVLKGKKVDKIAEAYDERIKRWLEPEEIALASMARNLVQTHEKAKQKGEYHEFISTYYLYNQLYNRSYILPKDIIATVRYLWEEEKRNK
jgi:GTPase-associated protein 1, N-terminal domain type 2/GTPase-associated protein 1, middle domain